MAARAELGADADVGAVLTMGALHEGHDALMRAARKASDVVVATVFVNPAQFGPSEDLARYPRPLAEDLRRCRTAGVDLVWTPTVADVYPSSPQIGIDPGPLGAELEGASRPAHFAGVLLIVAKFLSLLAPRRVYFGEKDYQQLTLVRAMVNDLDLPVDVVAVPTVREADGLARSSRNVYLDPAERAAAPVLAAALQAGQQAAVAGATRKQVVATANAVLATSAHVDVDYLELRGADLGREPGPGPARLLVAARVGRTRLIDNVAVELTA
ncbi:MAG: pantoate--beta-alanine ligase [bacterium]